MNLSQIDMLAALAAVIGVWMCGILSLRSVLWGLAAQTALLGTITWLHGREIHSSRILLFAGVVILVKAILIPIFLAWVCERIEARRDKGLTLNSSMALFAGCGALAVGYFLSPEIKGMESGNAGTAGMALSLLLIGMLLMITRRLAISQLIGFLVLENGIFLYALTQTHGMPMMVEMGVVFDVLVGVMVCGLVIFRLNRSFEHIDVTKLRGLQG